MALETHGYDLYVRSTDTNGKSSVRELRTWDKDKLLTSLRDSAAKENSKEKSTKAKVEQITREQYVKERGK